MKTTRKNDLRMGSTPFETSIAVESFSKYPALRVLYAAYAHLVGQRKEVLNRRIQLLFLQKKKASGSNGSNVPCAICFALMRNTLICPAMTEHAVHITFINELDVKGTWARVYFTV